MKEKQNIGILVETELSHLEKTYTRDQADMIYMIIAKSYPVGSEKRREYLTELRRIDAIYQPKLEGIPF